MARGIDDHPAVRRVSDEQDARQPPASKFVRKAKTEPVVIEKEFDSLSDRIRFTDTVTRPSLGMTNKDDIKVILRIEQVVK